MPSEWLATTAQVLAMFPGAVVTDFDAGGPNGAANIQVVLDRIAREVAAALLPECYRQMTQVDAEEVVRYAVDGQTAFVTGLTPLLVNSIHIWRYPSLAALMPGTVYGSQQIASTYGDWAFRAPVRGFNEIPAANYTINLTTGAIALQSISLTAGERVFASYDVDVTVAAFAMPSLGDMVVLGTAAELGKRLYSDGQQEWTLVSEYRDRYRGQFVNKEGGAISKAFAGDFVPDELRALTYWAPVERTSSEVASIRVFRG